MNDAVSGSFVPLEDIQQLRQYDRRIFDFDEEIVRKVSKPDAVMQRCNIRLSNYVSNVECKSYKDVVRKHSAFTLYSFANLRNLFRILQQSKRINAKILKFRK